MSSLKVLKNGRNIVLTTEDSAMDAFFENLERCREDDGMCLLKAAKIIREDLFGSNSLFNGNFDYSSQVYSVPKSLLVLLRMILEGININSESSYATNQAALSLAQLIKFNSVKSKRSEPTIRPRHTLSEETPLPVYLGLMIHSKSRMKGVIKKLATLGLSISYNRVSEIQEQVMKQEIKRFDEMGLFCPRNLKPNIFTTAAIDNIDQFDFINCTKPLSWDARFSISTFYR